MSRRTISSRIFGLTLVGVLLGIPALSQAADRVPLPNPPRGKGEHCVRPTEEMRMNHMKYLLHQRDLTMHEGIRTKTFSLKNCIECHVSKDANDQYIAINAPGQFCQDCHSYAGVKIDCFECHATHP